MDRLIAAVLVCWEKSGNGSISARGLGRMANAPVSSIYHHFGSLERLFLAAHEQGLKAAEQWCADRLRDLPVGGATAALALSAFPTLLAALIDDWCVQQRQSAFAWRECQLMASREPCYRPVLLEWQCIWAGFWEEICSRCGHRGRGLLTSYLFDGESLLHLMRWRRVVDRAGLGETCAGWSRWLGGHSAGEGHWRQYAAEQAGLEMPETTVTNATTVRIATVAVELLAEQGVASLTHRAVALRAGLTLGVVSYNFRTSADLARAAFELIYRQTVGLGGKIEDPAAMTADALTAHYGRYKSSGHLLPALDELLVAVARDPSLKAFAPQLRYWRGRSSHDLLLANMGPGRLVSSVDTALFSSFGSGCRRAFMGFDEEEASIRGIDAMQQLRNLLRSTSDR
ncbi:hypothetical protein GCM10011529_03340 [Polymorphobacter glacialis]|uniref:HTH tetR-type domain-containing protein n=2 Tax=Sandarakinorhabdus glacialis TaxID=1614636 RepID=A0A917E348_9SPHN|nr:hypothetical protein GCM10011529_03340 [Polymorphobacter glacialis]